MGKGLSSHSYGSLGFAKISCPVGSYDNYVNRGSAHTPTREKKNPWFIASVHSHGANTPTMANWCEDTISSSNQGNISSSTPLHANLLYNYCFQNTELRMMKKYKSESDGIPKTPAIQLKITRTEHKAGKQPWKRYNKQCTGDLRQEEELLSG